jgi:hypothetical protein
MRARSPALFSDSRREGEPTTARNVASHYTFHNKWAAVTEEAGNEMSDQELDVDLLTCTPSFYSLTISFI